MDKAHEVQKAVVEGTMLRLRVDGRDFEIDLVRESQRLARATPEQRAHFEVFASGHGIHWPDIDEDLSIDGLIGARHQPPPAKVRT